MKIAILCVVFTTIIVAVEAVSPLAWNYVNGPVPIVSNRAPSVGPVGIESDSYWPGANGMSCSAVDSNGNFWNYGPFGRLMRFNVVTNRWSLISNRTNGNVNAPGIFSPSYDMESSDYIPGSRSTCTLMIDPSNDNVFVFGGTGVGYSGVSGALSDTWRWRPSTQQWTWIAGSSLLNSVVSSVPTRGVYSIDYYPSARYSQSRARYGSVLYIFGGLRADAAPGKYKNDLWSFDMSTPNAGWAWLAGETSEVAPTYSFGDKGVPSDSVAPQGRHSTGIDFDSNGVLWLFGGSTGSSLATVGTGNDLFSFNTATLQWTWVGGSTLRYAAAGVSYGTLGVASATNQPGARFAHGWAADRAGMLWLVGGAGQNSATSGLLNDVWRYDSSVNQWTWFGGSNTGINLVSSFTTQGVPSTDNILGSRYVYSNLLIDRANNMMIRGTSGWVVGETPQKNLDELWRPNSYLICTAGQTKPSPIENECSLCPAGYYGDLVGEARPLCAGACPAGTTSLPGATSISDCF